MSERKYSVTEIDALRRAVDNKYLWGCYSPPQTAGARLSRSYKEEEKAAAVEQRVRTHMLAGHTADDLYASENNNDETLTRTEGIT